MFFEFPSVERLSSAGVRPGAHHASKLTELCWGVPINIAGKLMVKEFERDFFKKRRRIECFRHMISSTHWRATMKFILSKMSPLHRRDRGIRTFQNWKIR